MMFLEAKGGNTPADAVGAAVLRNMMTPGECRGRLGQVADWSPGAQLGAATARAGARHARGLAAAVLAWTLGHASLVAAAPLGGWSVSAERLFGMTRVTRARGDDTIRTSNYNVLADQAPHAGYSSPRLAADHVLEIGLSVGGAVGVHAVELDGSSVTVWVLAPRVGYFWQLAPVLAVWPRVGVTRLWIDDGAAEDETAITLEVPLVVLVAEQRLGLTLTPHIDIGLPGGDVGLQERGVQFGAAVFF